MGYIPAISGMSELIHLWLGYNPLTTWLNQFRATHRAMFTTPGNRSLNKNVETYIPDQYILISEDEYIYMYIYIYYIYTYIHNTYKTKWVYIPTPSYRNTSEHRQKRTTQQSEISPWNPLLLGHLTLHCDDGMMHPIGAWGDEKCVGDFYGESCWILGTGQAKKMIQDDTRCDGWSMLELWKKACDFFSSMWIKKGIYFWGWSIKNWGVLFSDTPECSRHIGKKQTKSLGILR